MDAVNRLRVLIALTGALVSCSPPPFDLAISQSIGAMKKLTLANPAPIVMDAKTNDPQQDFVFYPERTMVPATDFSYGFLLSVQPLQVYVFGVGYNAADGRYYEYGRQGQSLPNPDPNAPPVLARSVRASHFFFGMAFDALTPDANGYAMYQGTPPAGMGSMPNGMNGKADTEVPGGPWTHWLLRDGSGYFKEAHSQIMGPSLPALVPVGSGSLHPVTLIPAGINRVQYFYDPDPLRMPNRSYASWYDASGGSWKACMWWEDPAAIWGHDTMLPKVTSRIDDLLSTGELFSTEGGMGRVYSRDGEPVGSPFTLGTLRYIGEMHDVGVAKVYFSQCLRYDDQLHFNVYSSRLCILGSFSAALILPSR
jgi:hypothetical protein